MCRSPPTDSQFVMLPLPRSPVLLVRAIRVQRARLPHSRLRHFPFPSHSLPVSPLPLGGLEPPHPCPLGCRRKLYTNSIRQVIAILAHPRVRGTVTYATVFFCGLFQTDKRSSATSRGSHLYPPIHPIYIAPLCSALAPQR